jgi:hypothetical protein
LKRGHSGFVEKLGQNGARTIPSTAPHSSSFPAEHFAFSRLELATIHRKPLTVPQCKFFLGGQKTTGQKYINLLYSGQTNLEAVSNPSPLGEGLGEGALDQFCYRLLIKSVL